jgi:hypothetical protein
VKHLYNHDAFVFNLNPIWTFISPISGPYTYAACILTSVVPSPVAETARVSGAEDSPLPSIPPGRPIRRGKESYQGVECHAEEADVWMSVNLSLALCIYPLHLGRACLNAGILQAVNAVDNSTTEQM